MKREAKVGKLSRWADMRTDGCLFSFVRMSENEDE
jgi:hypothetical protein